MRETERRASAAHVDDVFAELLAGSRQHASGLKGAARLRAHTEFVHERIRYDHAMTNVSDLKAAVRDCRGVCKHLEGALEIILERDGFRPRKVSGLVRCGMVLDARNSHAWVRVPIGNRRYLADPTAMVVGPYSDFSTMPFPSSCHYAEIWDWHADGMLLEGREAEVAAASGRVRPLFERFVRAESAYAASLGGRGRTAEQDRLQAACVGPWCDWRDASLREIEILDPSEFPAPRR